MRKIEQQMLSAIKNRKSWKLSNTEVEICGDTTVVKLFNNTIAKITPTTLLITDATWRSKTTKSRLNALLHWANLPSVQLLYQYKYEWFIGSESWTGSKEYKLNQELKCL